MSRIKFDVRYKGLLSMGYEAMDVSNRDLDDMMYSGVFYGFNIINAPDINYTQTIVTRHNENWVVQETKDYIDRIYLRSYKDGSWGDWTELVVTHDCNEPDKEIIIVERPHSHGVATPQSHGFMSAEDKKKLDSIFFDEDNGVITPGDHEHEEYKESIKDLSERMVIVEEDKADINHLHDDRYIPIFSHNKPSHHNVIGQVWIETLNQ